MIKKIYRLARSTARLTLDRMESIALHLGTKSGLLASAYYMFYSRRFDREHHAVIQGRVKYLNRLEKPVGSISLLRRNIHRLEKGLIMRPRRTPFAADYIKETLGIYEKVVTSTELNVTNEVLWSRDVLKEYFRVCGEAEKIAPLKARFESLPDPKGSCVDSFAHINLDRIPYAKHQSPESAVAFEEFEKLCICRRSVRWFDGRTVDSTLIDKAITAARLAPSACNRQPYRFLVFNNPQDAADVARLAGGTGGFAQQIPALIAVVGDLSNYFHERDRHLIYVDASLAAMTFMLAAETLGLSTCPINWSDVPEREKNFYKLIPSVPEYERPIMLIAVGYADPEGAIPYSSRKEIDTVRTLNPPLAR